MQAAAANKPIKRARYAHGIQLPRVADGRSRYAKRFRKLVEDFVAQIGGDPSPEDAALIRQTAHLVLTSEQMQAASINGEDVDVDSLIRINSETRRNLGMLKVKAAKNKPPAPTIHDLVAELEADEAAEEAAS
jgi:hypothetical protein